MYSIVEFDKSRIKDYLCFFDKANSGSVVCYCTLWNMTQKEIDRKILEPVIRNEAKLFQSARKAAIEMIDAEKMHGYLAYEGKTPVGWCNCDDKGNYTFLARHVPAGPGKEKTKSIVCLKVTEDKDFFEVGSALLETVCKSSKAEGYSCIEVYPHEGAMICSDFGDSIQLYQANGFELLSMNNGAAVLRKGL